MTVEIVLSIATFLAIMAAAWFIIVFVITRFKKEATVSADADKTGAKGSIMEKVKKTFAERPSWLVTLAAVGGGWLFLLFSAYVLLPDTWRWLEAHQELLWMTPLAIFAAQMLRATKKEPAKYLAYAIILVLLIAFVKAVPWGSGSESADTRRAGEQARIAEEMRWENCIQLPYNTTRATDSISLTTPPPGVESPCYIIRDGYFFRTAPRALVKIVWRDGRVFYDEPKRALNFGDSIQNAMFIMTSLAGGPVQVVVEFKKR